MVEARDASTIAAELLAVLLDPPPLFSALWRRRKRGGQTALPVTRSIIGPFS